jgi:hypothetical protein
VGRCGVRRGLRGALDISAHKSSGDEKKKKKKKKKKFKKKKKKKKKSWILLVIGNVDQCNNDKKMNTDMMHAHA